jgi:hypothetical protein
MHNLYTLARLLHLWHTNQCRGYTQWLQLGKCLSCHVPYAEHNISAHQHHRQQKITPAAGAAAAAAAAADISTATPTTSRSSDYNTNMMFKCIGNPWSGVMPTAQHSNCDIGIAPT